MNIKTIHSAINQVHQIVGYAQLIKTDPNKSQEYADLIKKKAYEIDAIINDITQTKDIDSPQLSSKKKIKFTQEYLNNKKVLIVDDLIENRTVFKDIFSLLQCEIKSAQNGEEALSICENFEPDIVCMDIVMPKMNGDEVTLKLKNNGCKAKFIAVSAVKEQSQEVLSIFDAWLSKPFTINQMIDALYSLKLHVKTTQNNIVPNNIELLSISDDAKKEILNKIQLGALSELKKIVKELPQSYDRDWLIDKISKMDFQSIEKTILSS